MRVPHLARLVLVALLASTIASCAAAADTQTSVIILRHAEKDSATGLLTPEGGARAQELAEVLGDASVTAIFASDQQRTVDTVGPLAERLGLPVQRVPVTGDAGAYAAELAALVRAQPPGGVVCVCNHSNIIPLLVRALGAPDVPALDEKRDFDQLFLVTLGDGPRASLVRARYGAPRSANVP